MEFSYFCPRQNNFVYLNDSIMRVRLFHQSSILYVALLILLLSVVGMERLHAQEVIIDGLRYSLSDTTATVLGGSPGDLLEIPSSVSYNGNVYSVTAIGEGAFWCGYHYVGDLTIPGSVKEIGEEAFRNCWGFTGRLTIPNSVSVIGRNAFAGCIGFTEVFYDAKNCMDTSSSFSECGGILIIGDDVERIPARIFWNASFTGNLVIPSSVISIGDNAFFHCTGFSGSLVIPDSVTEIGANAFSLCSGFSGYLSIPNSITELKEGVFQGCFGFIGDLVIPDSVTIIGDCAFADCQGFTGNLNIPDSVREIGFAAFADCSGFTSNLIIPNSVTTIGRSAFYGCSGFEGSLTISSSVTYIRSLAFSGCVGFNNCLVLCETPPQLEDSPFDESLTHLIVPCGCIPVYEVSDWHNHFTTITDDCTNVTEVPENMVSLYPNPTNGLVRIEAENIKHITISNALGQSIYASCVNCNVFDYDCGRHGAGLYFIKIETANGMALRRVSVTM